MLIRWSLWWTTVIRPLTILQALVVWTLWSTRQMPLDAWLGWRLILLMGDASTRLSQAL